MRMCLYVHPHIYMYNVCVVCAYACSKIHGSMIHFVEPGEWIGYGRAATGMIASISLGKKTQTRSQVDKFVPAIWLNWKSSSKLDFSKSVKHVKFGHWLYACQIHTTCSVFRFISAHRKFTCQIELCLWHSRDWELITDLDYCPNPNEVLIKLTCLILPKTWKSIRRLDKFADFPCPTSKWTTYWSK